MTGVIILLHQFYVIEVVMPHSWYMAIPIAFGALRLLGARSAEGVGSGVSWILLGLWAWACFEDWRGLTWSNSWPIALAAVGLGMVIKALPSLFPDGRDHEWEWDDDDAEPSAENSEGSRNHA